MVKKGPIVTGNDPRAGFPRRHVGSKVAVSQLRRSQPAMSLKDAKGWRGAFAFDPIAQGDGAASFYDAMIQEYQ